MRLQNRLFFAAVAAAFLTAGCVQSFQKPAEPADTRAADEATIRAADQDFAKCVEAKDIEKCMAVYADDSVLLEASGAAISKENIRKAIQGLIAAPGVKVTVTTTSVLVARSGDLALDQGTVQITTTDKSGKPVNSTIQYALTWKRTDDTWKIATDTSAPLK
jgi:uncharacterized protein (TIGR02246 family)